VSNFIQVTPFMFVPDIERGISFFRDILGFQIPFRQGTYAYVHRETVGFRLFEAPEKDVVPSGTRRCAYYVDVRDVDRLYAELKPKLETLPAGDVRGPVDQPWNQRELLVLAPDGNLIAFGQAIPQPEGCPAEE